MTECNSGIACQATAPAVGLSPSLRDCRPTVATEPLTATERLTPLGRREVVLDFAGGWLTSDAGLLLLREVDRRLGLLDAINAVIPDPRDPRLTIHEQRELLAQRIMALAAGYEDGNDHQTLRGDPALQTAVGRVPDVERPLGSPPTLCRLENRISRATHLRLHEVLVEQFLHSFEQPPEEIILDLDATDDPLHGEQEGRFFHGYYDGYCYLPLYVFCGEHLLVAYLRPSNIDGAYHSRAVVKWLVERIRQRWPQVRIVLRGDSGFCRWRLLRWCDRHDVQYVIGLAKNKRLTAQAQAWQTQAEAAFQATQDKQRLFGEFSYAAESWDRQRRVIVKAERLVAGPNTRFIVTNRDGDPQRLYDDCYCQRGDMENRIKEQQLMLFADRTSCHALVANQFRMLLSGFAYVLLCGLRRLAGTLSTAPWQTGVAGTASDAPVSETGVEVVQDETDTAATAFEATTSAAPPSSGSVAESLGVTPSLVATAVAVDDASEKTRGGLESAASVLPASAASPGSVGSNPWARAQVSTLRLRLIKVAARVVVSARRVVFHLASSCPLQALFRAIFRQLAPPPTSESVAAAAPD